MEIEVKGYSGCQIDVANEEGLVYIYKSTKDPKYLNRLSLQAKKQMAAANKEYQHIRVPKIYKIVENEQQTTIKMEYVYSKNFIEFFEQAGFEQVDYLINELKGFIEYEIESSKMCTVSPIVFREKFSDICIKIEINPLYLDNPDLAHILNRCRKVFDSLHEMTIPVGVCHGDLTFSNILFSGNNYYLIDFLDSFIETPLQDIVKIRQDTEYRWSQLMYSKPYDALRLRIIWDKIDYEIDSYFRQKYNWYRENYNILQLMNILRILPYTHEQNVVTYLANILVCILDSLQQQPEKTIPKTEDTFFSNNTIRSSGQRTLIMPIAAYKSEFEHHIPKVFLIAENGMMHCIHALKSLDLSKYNRIYITILRQLDVQYALSDRLALQMKINGIKNAEIVILEEPTSSQPETIYYTIKQKEIHGSIFIKDSDCWFSGDDIFDNAIAIYPLEELNWVNPKNKSYVNVDEMYYITNIIEKKIVSHYFTAGGYSFADADIYCHYYQKLRDQKGLYLSHIVYLMLINGHSFRPVITKAYEDFDFKF